MLIIWGTLKIRRKFALNTKWIKVNTFTSYKRNVRRKDDFFNCSSLSTIGHVIRNWIFYFTLCFEALSFKNVQPSYTCGKSRGWSRWYLGTTAKAYLRIRCSVTVHQKNHIARYHHHRNTKIKVSKCTLTCSSKHINAKQRVIHHYHISSGQVQKGGGLPHLKVPFMARA